METFARYLGKIARVREALDSRIVGQRRLKTLLITCFLAGGLRPTENTHILLRSVPGLGKTETAKTFARAFSLAFKRIQFQPDQMPKDFFFRYEQDPETRTWKKHEGAIYTNILLADEINRAHPGTHSGLLEAMAEGQFTEQGETIVLPQPFMVIGTFNPVEQKGTYGFLEALKDRFTMQVDLPYPSREEERLINEMHEKGGFPEINPVLLREEVFEIRKVIQDTVTLPSGVRRFIEECVRASRPEENPDLAGRVKQGLSPRGGIWLTRTAKVAAFLEGRDYVLPRDVEQLIGPVCMHRIVLADEVSLTKEASELAEEVRNVEKDIVRKAASIAKHA